MLPGKRDDCSDDRPIISFHMWEMHDAIKHCGSLWCWKVGVAFPYDARCTVRKLRKLTTIQLRYLPRSEVMMHSHVFHHILNCPVLLDV
jgi:hypothetical protein